MEKIHQRVIKHCVAIILAEGHQGNFVLQRVEKCLKRQEHQPYNGGRQEFKNMLINQCLCSSLPLCTLLYPNSFDIFFVLPHRKLTNPASIEE
jgi:hypothetical protein